MWILEIIWSNNPNRLETYGLRKQSIEAVEEFVAAYRGNRRVLWGVVKRGPQCSRCNKYGEVAYYDASRRRWGREVGTRLGSVFGGVGT